MERHFEEVLLELGWEKVQIGNVCLFIQNEDYSSAYVVSEDFVEHHRCNRVDVTSFDVNIAVPGMM